MVETTSGSIMWKQLEERVTKLQGVIKRQQSAVNLLNLLDALDNLILDLDFPTVQKNKSIETILKTYKRFKSDLGEVQKKTEQFRKIKLIDRGAFGDVHLVRHKVSRKVFAMKSVSKSMVDESFWLERDIMAFTNSPWLVQLCCSFQDDNNLYMVMDYLPCGDLSSLMNKGCMPEEVAKFYIAEVVLALEALHSMCYIHYDIKPENVLLDQCGHVKLADFGLSIKTDSLGITDNAIRGGTPVYAAPEVVRLRNGGGWLKRDCDWWSVGVVLYEMLIGRTPFDSDSLSMVFEKIRNYKDYLKFPDNKPVSDEARDIICGFLTDSFVRLGSGNIDDIKQHPFFENDQWTFDTIHETAAPIVPELNFQSNSEAAEDHIELLLIPEEELFRGDQFQFFGFTHFNEKKLFGLPESQRNENVNSTKEKKFKLHKKQQKVDHRTKQPANKTRYSELLPNEQHKVRRKLYPLAQDTIEPASRNEVKKSRKKKRFPLFSNLWRKIKPKRK